jgi:hypothetical protein
MILTEKQKIDQLQKEVPKLMSEMAKAGYTANEMYLSLPQFVFETGYFTNTGYRVNNPAGLTYSVNQKDSTQGPPRPPKEGGFYSAFSSLQPALKLHLNTIRKIKKAGNKLPVPATATNFTDYAKLLYANGYYTGTPANATPAQKIANYANGLISIDKRIQKIDLKKKNLIQRLYQLFF